MELIIDEGNTRAKAAVFINNGIHKVVYSDTADAELHSKIEEFQIERIIISSVRKPHESKLDFWKSVAPTLVLDHTTPLPITNLYQTPETLGKDRLAAVIGGRFLYPTGNILAIDAGTCITYDILTSDEKYLGGSISPGIGLRYRALHEFTGSLPHVDLTEFNDLYGSSTETAIASGVLGGLIAEIHDKIERYEKHFSPLTTVICGGESRHFVNQIKKKIFANQNLVLIGLHKILKFNDPA